MKSKLSIANELLRSGDFHEALDVYVDATHENPYLYRIIASNLSLIKPEQVAHDLLAKYQKISFRIADLSAANAFNEMNSIVSTVGSYSWCIDSIEYEGFELKMRVRASNVKYRNMPVRFQIKIADKVKKEYLVRAPILPSDPKYDFFSTVDLVISPNEKMINIELVDEDGIVFATFKPITYFKHKHVASKRFIKSNIQSDHDTIIGNVERISSRGISGWALNTTTPGLPVELVLSINSNPYAIIQTSLYRQDVYEKFGGSEYSGFYFEIPPAFNDFLNNEITVKATLGVNKIRNNVAYSPKSRASGNSYSLKKINLEYKRADFDKLFDKKISIIILNRNGASLLKDMFASVQTYSTEKFIEWIVVDHNSDDESRAVCEEFLSVGVNIKFISRSSNYTFSESNNYGAQFATGDILIFANNDLIFPLDIFHDFGSAFLDSDVGVVGVRLLDYSDSEKTEYKNVTQHSGVYFETELVDGWVRPYELRVGDESNSNFDTPVNCPIVTGAFFGVLAEDFKRVGGFSEVYNYGLEDVDLCLRFIKILGKKNISRNDLSVIHHRGFSRNKIDYSALRRRSNNTFFSREWGGYLRTRLKEDILKRIGYWSGKTPTVAFAVTDSGELTSAGEYFTAKELANALQELIPLNVVFLKEDHWYDLSGIDILVTMVNKFDLHKVKRASPYLISINWTRQWFDRWVNDPSLFSYDYVFASSAIAAKFIKNKTGIDAYVMPIASNINSFGNGQFKDELKCDYVFTGSKFGISREVEFCLDPSSINGLGRVYGFNWEGTLFENICHGPVSYPILSDVYASTKIVIDDANFATKNWGSCNSRVFDALASGCLLITNGASGVDELFGGLVPTFNDKESLTKSLNYWLSNENERLERVKILQRIVREEHSYKNRANIFLNTLTSIPHKLSIAIKCPAKYSERNQWGDFHFANSLAASLREIGYKVRVDCRESWDSGLACTDDVVIALRGLVRYKPKVHQVNFLWVISHPDLLTVQEVDEYDKCFVASEIYAEKLKDLCSTEVEVMLQAVDIDRFNINAKTSPASSSRKILFVGNSRGIFRDSVKWAIEAGVHMDIFGAGWEPFVDGKLIKSTYVPNEILSEIYSSYSLVLCDHWEDMKRLGFISNRIFDVIASGGVLLSDYVEGIQNIVPGGVVTYSDKKSFLDCVLNIPSQGYESMKVRSDYVCSEHSFDNRATQFKRSVDHLFNLKCMSQKVEEL